MRRSLLPLAVFVVLIVLLGIGLTLDPRAVPSALIDKPAPAFSLPRLAQPQSSFSPAQMRGKVWLLNVWASWCVACRQEHPVLVAFAKHNALPLYGLNYKDQRANALGWLSELGNPYIESFSDLHGRVGIDYGVYGVPETFLIDKSGIIRYKHIGPITPEVLDKTILPLMRKLGA